MIRRRTYRKPALPLWAALPLFLFALGFAIWRISARNSREKEVDTLLNQYSRSVKSRPIMWHGLELTLLQPGEIPLPRNLEFHLDNGKYGIFARPRPDGPYLYRPTAKANLIRWITSLADLAADDPHFSSPDASAVGRIQYSLNVVSGFSNIPFHAATGQTPEDFRAKRAEAISAMADKIIAECAKRDATLLKAVPGRYPIMPPGYHVTIGNGDETFSGLLNMLPMDESKVRQMLIAELPVAIEAYWKLPNSPKRTASSPKFLQVKLVGPLSQMTFDYPTALSGAYPDSASLASAQKSLIESKANEAVRQATRLNQMAASQIP